MTTTHARTSETLVRIDYYEKPPGPLLNEREVAAALHVSVKTVQRWRQQGVGPRAIKHEGFVRYLVRDVRDWVDQGRR